MSGSGLSGGQLRWYRFRDQIWFSAAPGCAFLALLAAILVRQGLGPAGAGPIEVTVGAMLAAAAPCLPIFALRSGIGVGNEGVIVRSVTGRSKRLPWPEVTGFREVNPRLVNGSATRGVVAVAVICRDGEALITGGCYSQRWSKKSGYTRVRDMVRALQNERAAAGQHAP